MNRRKLIVILNVLLVCAMVIHVGIRMYLHQFSESSAPAYVEVLHAVYYLIPLAVINIVNLIVSKLSKAK